MVTSGWLLRLKLLQALCPQRTRELPLTSPIICREVHRLLSERVEGWRGWVLRMIGMGKQVRCSTRLLANGASVQHGALLTHYSL